jgi:hypothetical protein
MLATLRIGPGNTLVSRIAVFAGTAFGVRHTFAIVPNFAAISCTTTGRKVNVRFDIDLAPSIAAVPAILRAGRLALVVEVACSIPAVAAVVWTTFRRLQTAVTERLPLTASTLLADAVAAMRVIGL